LEVGTDPSSCWKEFASPREGNEAFEGVVESNVEGGVEFQCEFGEGLDFGDVVGFAGGGVKGGLVVEDEIGLLLMLVLLGLERCWVLMLLLEL
jgi:hypothetical protein